MASQRDDKDVVRVDFAFKRELAEKVEGVVFISPSAGTVAAINRGAKRKFESIVIDVQGDEQESFGSHTSLENISKEQTREILVRSGEWTALRTRPFSRTPHPHSEAKSIFVTAMDSNPLSPEAELIISNHKEAFIFGLMVVSKINDGKVYVCTRDDSRVPGSDIPNINFDQALGSRACLSLSASSGESLKAFLLPTICSF